MTRRLIWVMICCMGFALEGFCFPASEVQSSSLLSVLEQQLKAEESKSELLAQRLVALQQFQQMPSEPYLLTSQALQRLKTSLVMAEAESSNIELSIKTAQLELELTQTKLQSLQRRSMDIRPYLAISPEIEIQIQEQIKLIEVQQKRVRILQNIRDLHYKIVAVTREWCKQLQVQSQSAINNERQTAFYSLIMRLQNTQKKWVNQLEGLSNQFMYQADSKDFIQKSDLLPILEALTTEEKSHLIHIQLALETINDRLQQMSETLVHHPPLMILNTLQKPLDTLLSQLQFIEDLLQKKIVFFKEAIQLVMKESESGGISHSPEKIENLIKSLRQLILHYQEQSLKTNTLIQQGQTELSLFTGQLHAYLSNRQDLPGFDLAAWKNLIERVSEIPKLFSAQLVNLSHLIVTKVKQAPWWQSLMAGFIFLGWMRGLFLIKRLLNAKRKEIFAEPDQVIPASFVSFLVHVVNKHLYILMGMLAVGNVLLIWKVPFSAFFWLLKLFSVIFIFSVILQTCRFWLVDTAIEENKKKSSLLYYRLRRVLSVGGLITLFSLIVHQVVLDYEVRNFVARLFMLFLVVIAFVLFRIWFVVPKLLEGYWVNRPRYLERVVRWVSFLLPMSVLLNAILGLIGYVQLAWAIVGYQSLLLLVLAIYPLISGLLKEVFNWLSEQSIRRFRNGWLWSEALLKPLYQLLKLCIFSAILILFFRFAGLRDQSFIFSVSPSIWLTKQLLVIADIPVNALKLIELLVMLLIVAWLVRWTREFAYRWIFANLKDLGLRNSLSIFTQYMAVFLSILATLQIAGLTLSVLKYVLSGFAIGLSFGLRDLFNNFVTGILLLVERPVKVGDWVTIGDCNGQVIHIGARSITINTEDHQELMVPNADLFYKHFINWTRHDSIVKINIPLSVSRSDNPFKIKEIILEVINTIPKILSNPAPEVYFKATDQMLLAFKIEYYVDLSQITSRSEVNSQFLFSLWKRFCEEKISPPEIIQAIQLKGELELDSLPSSTLPSQQHA